jgi:hypothetical protein
MAGHPSIPEQDLYGAFRESHIHLLFYELIGYAVVVVIDLDMIVDIDPGLFPFGILVRLLRKGLQCRLVKGFE